MVVFESNSALAPKYEVNNLLYALYLVHKYAVLLNIPSMLQAELRKMPKTLTCKKM